MFVVTLRTYSVSNLSFHKQNLICIRACNV